MEIAIYFLGILYLAPWLNVKIERSILNLRVTKSYNYLYHIYYNHIHVYHIYYNHIYIFWLFLFNIRHDIANSHTDAMMKGLLEACVTENDVDKLVSNLKV